MPVTVDTQLLEFIRESNRIERINREPTDREIKAHVEFLSLTEYPRVEDLQVFVWEVAGAVLRQHEGMNVTLPGASQPPPPGGAHISDSLTRLLGRQRLIHPFDLHVRYEILHPFKDGNGRSGRVLWAWNMRNLGNDPFVLPFLQYWYYQSLNAGQTMSRCDRCNRPLDDDGICWYHNP